MNRPTEHLGRGGYSCVVAKGNEVRTFTRQGVADLYELFTSDRPFLRDSSVADKVVGKAAATLIILGGVSRLYADVISEPAIDLLRQSAVEFSFGKAVPFVANRDQSGVCPLENLCMKAASLQEALVLIETFI